MLIRKSPGGSEDCERSVRKRRVEYRLFWLAPGRYYVAAVHPKAQGIATNPGALDGQVVRSGPGPVADIPVLLLPNIRRRNELYRTTTTNVSGRFHFDRVPPGDYKVFSWEEVEDGACYDAEFMRAVESRGISVQVGEGLMETARIP